MGGNFFKNLKFGEPRVEKMGKLPASWWGTEEQQSGRRDRGACPCTKGAQLVPWISMAPRLSKRASKISPGPGWCLEIRWERKRTAQKKRSFFSPDKRPLQWKDMRDSAALCVEDEALSPERSSIRKPGGAKPESSGWQVGRETSEAGCRGQDEKVGIPFLLLVKWHLYKLPLNQLNQEAIRLMWL